MAYGREDDTRITILRREGGAWSREEANELARNLKTETCTIQAYPEYVLVRCDWVLRRRDFTEEEVKRALGSDAATFSLKHVTGMQHPKLPFRPSF